MSQQDKSLIEAAAHDAGSSISSWVVQAAREEARWGQARRIARELAEEIDPNPEDYDWAQQVLGLSADNE